MEYRLERAFSSRVARRIAVLFVGCAVIPLAGLGVLTVRRTTGQFDLQARTRLHYDVKAFGMTGGERLGLLEQRTRIATAALSAASLSRDGRAALDALLPPGVHGLLAIRSDGSSVAAGARIARPMLSSAQQAHLLETGALILSPDEAIADGSKLMIVRVSHGDSTALGFASIDHRRLWDVHEEYLLPPGADVCVYEREVPLVCSAGVDGDLKHAAARVSAHSASTLSAGGQSYLVSTWALPLKGRYLADPWVLAMSRPQKAARAPVKQFARDFAMILLATGLLVSLVTVSQVRRTLRPLTALMDGTRRLAARNFDAPLHVKSGDEFEDLANAFNWLTTDLKRQFEQLEAFNLGTLAALARTVDAKSPWTAGHSERVTALAVEVGRELGMPEADLVDLARGGLVHDIGKIATPVEILDKEGALTADEKAIMQRHPERGAQILEPITAYARLLPIVREHHERWDGNGYPRGLAGLEIARTARVLAIADTYDAMQSDRPYRKGLPLHVVLGVITRESGQQFDPDVVRAFERLMARRGGALG